MDPLVFSSERNGLDLKVHGNQNELDNMSPLAGAARPNYDLLDEYLHGDNENSNNSEALAGSLPLVANYHCAELD